MVAASIGVERVFLVGLNGGNNLDRNIYLKKFLIFLSFFIIFSHFLESFSCDKRDLKKILRKWSQF